MARVDASARNRIAARTDHMNPVCIDCLTDVNRPNNEPAVTFFRGNAVCARHARERTEVMMKALSMQHQ